jgi:hypothetical protein
LAPHLREQETVHAGARLRGRDGQLVGHSCALRLPHHSPDDNSLDVWRQLVSLALSDMTFAHQCVRAISAPDGVDIILTFGLRAGRFSPLFRFQIGKTYCSARAASRELAKARRLCSMVGSGAESWIR